MKAFSYFLISSIISIYSVEQSEQLTQVKFDSFSKGFRETIIIRQDSVLIIRTQIGNKSQVVRNATTKLEWQNLIKSVDTGDFTGLVDLPSPTNQRRGDGTPHSNIILATPTKEYNSGYFDGYNPNPKLKGIMNSILEIRKNEL